MQLNLLKIQNRSSELLHQDSIHNLIFDFGGVICNIDVTLAKKAFIDLGIKKFDTGDAITRTSGLFEALETGAVTPKEFRDRMRPFFETPVTDAQLDTAWNALLLDIPEPRIRLLEELRKHYRIFLLSNSNEIHYTSYAETLRTQFGYPDFDALFEKAWFSFRLGMKKPSPEIFMHVLRDANLDPSETLFIDDTLMHVEGAAGAGIHGHHLRIGDGEEIMHLFE
jgi:glucose-1-phosphatase